VDARALAVPDREDAVVFRVGEEIELLAAPDGRCSEILVHAGLEMDVVLLEEFARAPELLVIQAERGAAIAGDETCGIQPGGKVALPLQHGQPDQCLGAGQENASAL